MTEPNFADKTIWTGDNLDILRGMNSECGGTDHRDNLQMLCSHCNRIKGDRPQEYLVARLKEMAVL